MDESLLTGESVPVRRVLVPRTLVQLSVSPGGDDLPFVYQGRARVWYKDRDRRKSCKPRALRQNSVGEMRKSLRSSRSGEHPAAEGDRLPNSPRRKGGSIGCVLVALLYSLSRAD